MYQYASKGKAQSEELKSGDYTANKNRSKMGIKTPMQLMPQIPSTPLQMQLRPQQENSEAQPLPMILREEQTRLSPISNKPNNTGIPLQMKEKFENLSGFSFDDVKVHYNSDKPAQLQALAYTQGNQVYVAPGQEKHLGHELGHVVQQKQGIVRPTAQYEGHVINDDAKLEYEADIISIHSSQALEKSAHNTCKLMENPVIQGCFGLHDLIHTLPAKRLSRPNKKFQDFYTDDHPPTALSEEEEDAYEKGGKEGDMSEAIKAGLDQNWDNRSGYTFSHDSLEIKYKDEFDKKKHGDSVIINMTGNRYSDFAKVEKAPLGYTWHHHKDFNDDLDDPKCTMSRVESGFHSLIPHMGACAQYGMLMRRTRDDKFTYK